jgi:hypothetical protein
MTLIYVRKDSKAVLKYIILKYEYKFCALQKSRNAEFSFVNEVKYLLTMQITINKMQVLRGS